MNKIKFRNTSHVTLNTIADEARNTHINIGTGVDISIKALAESIEKMYSWYKETK